MTAGAGVYMYARMRVYMRVRAHGGRRLYVRMKIYFCEHKIVLMVGWSTSGVTRITTPILP